MFKEMLIGIAWIVISVLLFGLILRQVQKSLLTFTTCRDIGIGAIQAVVGVAPPYYYAGGIVLALVAFILRYFGSSVFWYRSIQILVLLCFVGDLFVLRIRRRRRLTLQLESVSYRVCLYCMYSLQGHPDSGTCPECGRSYTVAHLKQRWQGLLTRVADVI